MKNIILCSSNPILVKSLYAMLREDGNEVEIVEHPAIAVKKVLWGKHDCVIVDSEPFGLSAEDAAQIIRAVAPDMPVLFVGSGLDRDPEQSAKTPLDLEEFKRRIHSIAVSGMLFHR